MNNAIQSPQGGAKTPQFFSKRIGIAHAALVVAGLFGSAHAALPGQNLLVNGSAESAVDVGWTLTNGGNGWSKATDVNSAFDNKGGYFVTSYSMCSRKQEIDLLATGATPADLDQSPIIKVSEAIGCYFNNDAFGLSNGAGKIPDKFYIKVDLLDANRVVLATWNIGSNATPVDTGTDGSYTVHEHQFTGYPAGVRYIAFEDGGYDVGYWGGNYGSYHDAASVTFAQDTDGDGLPDAWELANGTNVNVPDAEDDLDHDGLSNMEEYNLGTKANVADTDGDGYIDSVEDKIGTWGFAGATGTDPLNPDTDGDGIPDGAENPDLPYVDIHQTGTDPNKSDTDGDGFTDYIEILSGSNPKDINSVPTYTYSDILKENFDGGSVSSVYNFTKSLGTFQPAVVASGVAAHANVAEINNVSFGDTNNSLAFDAIPSNATSVKLTFDFRMSADVGGEAADGFGVGFFKTSVYAPTGGLNPGYTTGDGTKWEEPPGNNGIGDAAMFGFDVYGGTTDGNTVRMSGPAVKTTVLAKAVGTSQLNSGKFNRVTLTGIQAGNGSTAWTGTIIYDVDGTPTTQTLFSGVVMKNFDVTSEPFRIIFGGRTGGSKVTTDIDNVVLSSTAVVAAPEVPVVTAYSIDRTTAPGNFVLTWKSKAGSTYKVESSTTLTGTWTTVAASVASGGTSTTYNIPLTTGTPKAFYRVTPN